MEGFLRTSSIFVGLMETKQFKYNTIVEDYLLDCIKKGEIQIPTLGYLFQICPEYRNDMIRLYDGTFGLYKNVKDIPDDIKAAQGAVIDGFCYFYDITKSHLYGICTLNLKPLGVDPVLDKKVLDKTMKLNTAGNINAFRVDFTYDEFGTEHVNYKVVNHRTTIDESNVLLVPYSAGHCLCNMLERFLNQGSILAMKQVLPNNSVKIRCVSNNVKHLAHYCDSESACEGLKAEYYPLQAFVYAPVLGAPSTTAMKTKVDLFNLEGIAMVKSYEQCSRLGIQKVKDPVDALFKEQSVVLSMLQLKVSDPDGFTRLVGKLPENAALVNVNEGDIKASTITNYLHTATAGTVNKVLKMVPGASNAYNARMELVKSSEHKGKQVPAGDLKLMLNTFIIKVVWKKKDGTYSSAVCTNNTRILRKVYGPKYFSSYESIGVRIGYALDDIDSGFTLQEALETYGFDTGNMGELVGKIRDAAEETGTLKGAFYKVFNYSPREYVKKDNIVTARTLGAFFSGTEVEGSKATKSSDYYVSIDTNHLVRAEIVC